MENITNPRVFITYSWTNKAHELWVEELYRRLQNDGVEVTFDKIDLKLGTDKYAFMESMVSSDEIDRVIIVVDEMYAKKADEKKGGVGTETQIISPEIYNSVSENKFIPLVLARDENGNAILPIYLKPRMYIDFSDTTRFAKSYDELLRELYNQQEIKKAPLGEPPEYLFKQTSISNELRFIDYDMDRGNNISIEVKFKNYLDVVYDELAKHQLSFIERDPMVYGSLIFESISSMNPLKNHFVEFYFKIMESKPDISLDSVLDFLERLPQLLELPRPGTSMKINSDNFSFIIHEIFLSIISIHLKLEQYASVRVILKSNFQVSDDYGNKLFRFSKFHGYISSIDRYYLNLIRKKIKYPFAHLLLSRLNKKIDASTFRNADAFCFYFTNLENLDIEEMNLKLRWVAITCEDPFTRYCTLFDRMQLKRKFNKLKHLFGVENVNELKTLIERYKSNVNTNGNYYRNMAYLHELIDVNKIATLE